MKNYYRGSAHASECFAGGYIGADYGVTANLTDKRREASIENACWCWNLSAGGRRAWSWARCCGTWAA